MSLPKVLIIGQPFNNDTGGGITLSNLFNNWDRDKLAVACSGHLLLDNIDTNVCNTYYQLGYKENKWQFPFNLLQRKYQSGLLQFDKKRVQNLTIRKSTLRVKFIMNYLFPFLEYFGFSHYIYKSRLSDSFCNWVKEFNPDIIYAQAATRPDLLFCIAVADYFKKPFIFHMMDDWPSTISDKGPFKRYWFQKIDAEFRSLLDKSSILMSISEEMSRVYKVRYNKDFIPFHNPIDLTFWEEYQKNFYSLPKNPTILYAGRIGLGIETSLELIAKAIESVNKELKISARFVLQTAKEPVWAKNYPSLEQKEFVPYSQLPKTFSEADFLLLPYDFSDRSIKYIQYSMPTKGPEYMASGTPILLFAPEVTAIVKYCKKYQCAKIITKNNITTVSNAIKELIENQLERQQIAQNAKRIVAEKHNSKKVTGEFRTLVQSLYPQTENV